MAKAALKVVAPITKLVPFVGDTPILAGGLKIFNVNVTFEDLKNEFRENAHQRDTELRSTKHLMPVMPEHLEFACLVTITGEKILLNGHTRRHFWNKNVAIAPTVVRMTVYEIVDPAVNVADIEYRLYSSYDSRSAVKTSAHTVQGAMKKNGVTFDTKWMRAGQFVEALRAAGELCGLTAEVARTADASDLIKFFEVELDAFDQISPAKGRWPAAFTAAAMVMLRKAPVTSVARVLNGYNLNIGSKSENGRHNAISLMGEYRRKGLTGTGRFPTNRSDMIFGVTQMSRLIYLALTTPEAFVKEDDKHTSSFTREELKNLTVAAETVAKTI